MYKKLYKLNVWQTAEYINIDNKYSDYNRAYWHLDCDVYLSSEALIKHGFAFKRAKHRLALLATYNSIFA